MYRIDTLEDLQKVLELIDRIEKAEIEAELESPEKEEAPIIPEKLCDDCDGPNKGTGMPKTFAISLLTLDVIHNTLKGPEVTKAQAQTMLLLAELREKMLVGTR